LGCGMAGEKNDGIFFVISSHRKHVREGCQIRNTFVLELLG
jgi:hypothetical protein